MANLPIRARLVSEFIVEVTHLDMSLGNKAVWRTALEKYALSLQEMISESFAGERVAGSSTLGRNTPQWNRYKARHGLDPRRGHASGELQRALDARPLFQVRGITVNKKGLGRARIYFREDWLHSRVSHAEYYEKMKGPFGPKVRRRGILALAKSWLVKALPILNAAQAELAIKARRAASRNIGNRPARIRPSIGLTTPFVRKFRRLG